MRKGSLLRKFAAMSCGIIIVVAIAWLAPWAAARFQGRFWAMFDDYRPPELGVRRGQVAERTHRGDGPPERSRLLAPFPIAMEAPARGPDGSTKLRFKVPADTPLGIYPVRILTDEDISDPFPLAVGQLSVINENQLGIRRSSESRFVSPPAVVEGRLGDRAWKPFLLTGKAGERLLVQVQSAGFGSDFDAEVRFGFVAPGDRNALTLSGGDLADSPFFPTLRSSGTQDIRLGRAERPILPGRDADGYRLTIGALPAAAEVYPLGGRRGETIRVELRGGTLPGPVVVPVALVPFPGESVVRLRVPSDQKGQDGTPLDVEALPPLVVDDLPEVLEPSTPEAPAAEVPTPVVLNGRIDPKDDVDSFRLAVTPGRLYRVSLESHGLGSALRASLRVKSPRGQEWASGPTNTVEATAGVPEHETPDPSTVFVVPEGPAEVDLEIRGDWLDAGREPAAAEHGHAYRAKVVPVTPGFSVDLLTAQVGVPRGGTAAVGVVLRRDGFKGPVTLGLANPPPGVSFIPGSIPEGKSIGSFTIGASPDASFEPVYLDVVGRGLLPGSNEPIVAHARKALPFGEPTTMPYREPPDEADVKAVSPGIPAYLRTRVLTQSGLLAAPVRTTEIVGEALPRPIRLARGRSTFFRVTIRRSPRAEGRLTVDPLPLPIGLNVSQGLISERDNEAFISVDAEPDFPLGTTTVALLAKGTIGGVERSYSLPALTLEIVGDEDAVGFPDGKDAFMPER